MNRWEPDQAADQQCVVPWHWLVMTSRPSVSANCCQFICAMVLFAKSGTTESLTQAVTRTHSCSLPSRPFWNWKRMTEPNVAVLSRRYWVVLPG
jgi:hypothetical protein